MTTYQMSVAVLNNCLFSDSQKKLLKKRFNKVKFYSNTTSEAAAIKHIDSANIVMMDQFIVSITENILKNCKNLEFIILNTTAYDNLNPKLLEKYGVKFVHLKEYATGDVAEVAISMMLELNTRMKLAQDIVIAKSLRIPDYQPELVSDIWPGHPISEYIIRQPLKDQTVGIIGFGRIGSRCAEMCRKLGMKCIAYNRTKKTLPGIDFMSLKDLFRKSDIILITMSYNKHENQGIINKVLIDLAKSSSILISVSHPDLIDLNHLVLRQDKIRGVGLDYLVTPKVRKLIKAWRKKFCLIVTPHLGSQSTQSISNMTSSMIESAIKYAESKNRD